MMFTERTKSYTGFLKPPAGEFYCADVLRILPEIQERFSGQFKLIYLDPPFMTGRDFYAQMPVGEAGYAGKRAYYATFPLYSDTWESLEEYLGFLRAVLLGVKDLLCPDGVICLHADRHANAHLRLLLDEIFGEKSFINEIIWHYHSGGGAKNAFPAKHDTLLLYGRTPKVTIHPADAGYMRTDAKRNHMKRNVDETGRVYFSIRSNNKEYRYYEDEKIAYDDVWDIPHLQQKHPERTGFGTQKPLELLDRLVLSCTSEGDLVGDLFAGSGTTLISACRNGRRFLGVDHSTVSLLTIRRRLASEEGIDLTVYQPVEPADPVSVSIHRVPRDTRTEIAVTAYQPLDLAKCLPDYTDG